MARGQSRKNLAGKFCRCIKQVRKTVKPRQARGQKAKESAAIAICVRSVLGNRGRTLRKFKCKKKPYLETQDILKKQKGGYKYLTNERRAKWVETLAPYGNQIISQLPKINWSSFNYEGPVELDVIEIINNDNRGFGMAAAAAPEIQHEIQLATAQTFDNPYHVFGGAACELWATEIPSPRIRDFVDPTGDIDVNVSLPNVRILKQNRVYDGSTLHLVNEDGYTQLGDQYSLWLFNEVVRVLSPLAKDFDRPIFALPDKAENDETDRADIAEFYRNLLFTRMISHGRDMIKIQVSTKVMSDRDPVVNHLIEFIILAKDSPMPYFPYIVRGIPVPSPWQLVYQQIRGLTGRAEQIVIHWRTHPNENGHPEMIQGFHKIDNHCGRLLYLALLQKVVDGRPWPFDNTRNGKYFERITLFSIVNTVTPLYETKTMPICSFHFANFKQMLFSIFDSYPFVSPKGELTDFNSETHQRLNAISANE